MRQTWVLLTGALVLALPTAAPAVPSVVHHEGLLLDDEGIPWDGPVDLSLTIYDGANNELWSEDYDLELMGGYYAVRLGEDDDNPLLPALAGEGERILAVSVEGRELEPRHPLGTVPYAFVAETVVGDINPRSISVAGREIIDSGGRWIGPALTGVDAARLDGMDSSQFVSSAEQICDLLGDVDADECGLDASRLDGLDSAQFLRSDAEATMLSDLRVEEALHVAGTLHAGDVEVAAGSGIGVGVEAPDDGLAVAGTIQAGEIRVDSNGEECDAHNEGSIRYTGEHFEGCNGTRWVGLDDGGGEALPGTSFECVPDGWSYAANRIICTTTIDLPQEMAVLAHVTGHWSVSSGWGMVEIMFGDEAMHPAGNSPYVNKDGLHGYGTASWQPISTVRSKILPAGRHTVRYGVSTSGGTSLNGSSLHGVTIPTQGQGASASGRSRTTRCRPWARGSSSRACPAAGATATTRSSARPR